MIMKKVLGTGANGFLGRHLCPTLRSAGYAVRAGVRNSLGTARLRSGGIVVDEVVEIGDIAEVDPPRSAFKDCDAVVHLAARVHVMGEATRQHLGTFRRVNVEGTRRLVEGSVACGVRRFVFVSSVKVIGEATYAYAFSENTELHPTDPYAISKSEAEQVLLNTVLFSDIEITIVRPPLIYGPGVGGNLYRLLWFLYHRLPLILPPGDNTRSLIAVENLATLLAQCVNHPKAKNEVFVVSDGRDLSTRKLIQLLASGLRRRSIVFTMPQFMADMCNDIGPINQQLQRLSGSLRVDSSKARRLLEWEPPVSPEFGLVSTAKCFLATEQGSSGNQ